MNIKIRIKSIPWKVTKPFRYIDLVMDGLAEIIKPTIAKPMDDKAAEEWRW